MTDTSNVRKNRESSNGEASSLHLGGVVAVTGGTGEWAGASGTFTAIGTFANGAGEGFIEGEVCVL